MALWATKDNLLFLHMPKHVINIKYPQSFKCDVLRVDEYNGTPVFVVRYNGREYRVWKLPEQPDNLKTITCELHKTKGADGKPIVVLRQHVETPKETGNKQEPIVKQKPKRSLDAQLRLYAKWTDYMTTHKWHRFGNDGHCEICGQYFDVRKGWRVDMTDVLFCDECRKKIAEYKKKNKPYLKIIPTPMGNKMR